MIILILLIINFTASFKYKNSIRGKTLDNDDDNYDNGNRKKIGIIVLLKHLSNFWRILDMPLINCEINLILTGSENCILTD